MNSVGNAKARRPAAPRPHNPRGVAGSNQKPFRPEKPNNGTDRVVNRSGVDLSAESKGTGRG